MRRLIKWGWLLVAMGACGGLPAQTSAPAQPREVAGFPPEAEQALQAVTLAEGMQASLFAAEPLLANPVALSIDPRGRVYVCETYRVSRGVEDNRNHVDWIDDDLAARTVEDRLAFFKKHLEDDLSRYSSYEDRVRLLVDRNGDGQADFARVFADGFKGTLEGIGADVLAWGDQVYYACIPNLWSLRDTDGDGRADERDSLHYGYGVRVAFVGHDLHGLCIGPDGRLYFSIGDRGYHIETDDGVVADPETGAVFRCELDGSDLEVFATGFRNPQDLAFDENGYLFTGDNNSDSGDLARWVYVMEGADTGWRMAYQYLSDRGPWNRDRLWEPWHAEQPAYISPPIANFADGPSGLAYYPGTGLPREYQGNFFLCDFRGQASTSGIRTFKVKPQGASFELIDPEIFAWNCLPTDCEFGPDGYLYATDWIEGWDGTGKGRVNRYAHPESVESKATQEVQRFLSQDAARFKPAQLIRLLAHPDMRLRRLGQFELARRGQLKALLEVASKSEIQLARMHAVWGLGQIARTDKKSARVARVALTRLVHDVDPRIRVLAINLIGDERLDTVNASLLELLQDENLQVRYAAAIALGKLGVADAVGPLVQMIADNQGIDPALRHAGIMGLTGCGSESQLAQLRDHAEPSVRQAAVVALRRQASARLADFLDDDVPRVRGEAIRAIYDVPVEAALPALAAQIEIPSTDHEGMRRVLATHFRLGTEAHARALASFAATETHDPTLRKWAVDLLKMWQRPPSRDPVLGMWRPLTETRDPQAVVEAVKPHVDELLSASQPVRFAFTELAAEYQLAEVEQQLRAHLLNDTHDPRERAGMMLALGSLKPPGLRDLVDRALTDEHPEVRSAARVVLSQIDPDGSVPILIQGFREGATQEKQSAVAVLGRLGRPQADKALQVLMQAYLDDSIPPALRLDVMEAVLQRSPDNDALAKLMQTAMDAWKPGDRLAPFRDALHGGDALEGERLFFERVQLECARCHQVGGRGGKIGPALDEIGAQSRAYLLESIVQPDRAIAKGFESVILETDDGRIVTGIVQEKTDDQISLMQSDGTLVTVDQATVETERRGQSAMPANLIDKLRPFELRDLLEYLSQLQPSK